MLKKIKILIIVGTLLLFFIILFLISNTTTTSKSSISQESGLQASPPTSSMTKELGEEVVRKVFLQINGKRYESEVLGQTTAYDLMDKLQKEGKISFKAQTYPGMGKLIEEINGIKSGEGKYWIYYVNGQEAQVGVSNYKINPGDVVSWKLEKNY